MLRRSQMPCFAITILEGQSEENRTEEESVTVKYVQLDS